VNKLTAADIIKRLDLKPHPEGGHFRETHRDEAGQQGRSHSTAIYFLLARGERSHWHRIDAVEVWHYYAGDPLKLEIVDGSKEMIVRLGPNVHADEVPQAIVPNAISSGAPSLRAISVAAAPACQASSSRSTLPRSPLR